ncbi:uncharacterized protein YALI1_B25334g [Yarrowia lipolytica]|uniref:Secreted protein n=1 Tax=Yarrowia lipolytica TaxID=4952 RepID=A0A1D8N8H3_YARLL|nr:hypothetical protein YALI1_B25334g [Yarrowia lipolytica]
MSFTPHPIIALLALLSVPHTLSMHVCSRSDEPSKKRIHKKKAETSGAGKTSSPNSLPCESLRRGCYCLCSALALLHVMAAV